MHPSSILDIILVVHHEVEEATRNDRRYCDLMDNDTFYLRIAYVLPTGIELYGHLEPILLPTLDKLGWQISNMQTSKAFHYRLALDFMVAMKPATSSKATYIQWFLPIYVMVDLFSTIAEEVRWTATIYIFQRPSAELL